jgi:hypothetical protein
MEERTMAWKPLRGWHCIEAASKGALGTALSMLLACFSLCSPAAQSAELPKSPQGLLKELNLEAETLFGVDAEHQVPKEWLEKGRFEGQVKVQSI